jgi:predicted DNA-binding transcriptional regulator AlpA
MPTTTKQTPISATFPALLNAKHLQGCGLSRSMAYQLLSREDMPVVRIGGRVFMNRDLFFKWMEEQATGRREGGRANA